MELLNQVICNIHGPIVTLVVSTKSRLQAAISANVEQASIQDLVGEDFVSTVRPTHTKIPPPMLLVVHVEIMQPRLRAALATATACVVYKKSGLQAATSANVEQANLQIQV